MPPASWLQLSWTQGWNVQGFVPEVSAFVLIWNCVALSIAVIVVNGGAGGRPVPETDIPTASVAVEGTVTMLDPATRVAFRLKGAALQGGAAFVKSPYTAIAMLPALTKDVCTDRLPEPGTTAEKNTSAPPYWPEALAPHTVGVPGTGRPVEAFAKDVEPNSKLQTVLTGNGVALHGSSLLGGGGTGAQLICSNPQFAAFAKQGSSSTRIA